MIHHNARRTNWINRKSTKKRLINFVLIFSAITLILLTIFSKNGFLRVMYLKFIISKERSKVNITVEENKKLEMEVKLLNDNMGYIEYIARRDLGLVKSRDIIYLFKEKNEENQR